MNASHFGREFDLVAYNTLPSLGEADDAVNLASRLDGFLKSALKVFRLHNMQSRFGVSLMHSHSRCEQGERMIEYRERLEDGREALVTRPSRKDPHHESASPIVWQIRNEQFYPLEYSTDPLACSLLHDGQIPDSFLHDFRGLVSRSPIGQFVGLAVVSREFYNSGGQCNIALEFTNTRERSNIVVMSNRSEIDGNTVETAWSFEDQLSTERDCLGRCRRWCESRPAPEDHRKHHDPHHHP